MIRSKITSSLVFFILCLSSKFTLNSQVLGGHVELQRNLNTVTVKARLLFRCCPLPVINYLKINWGDGSPLDSIAFVGSFVTNLPTIYFMHFSGSHTFSPSGIYTITSIADYSLSPGFQNIPNSSTQKLVLRGVANMQIFAHPQTSNAIHMGDTVNCNFDHYNDYYTNLGMQSIDGDSLAFGIDLHPEIPGYIPPPLGINPAGTITFTSNASGNYNVSYKTDAWRRSVANGPYDLVTGTSYHELFITVCNIYLPATTGVEETKNNNVISVWPSLARDKLTVSLLTSEPTRLQLINSIGQEILALIVLQEKNEIDVSFLSPGIYYLKTQSGEKQQSVFKIIKE